MKTDSGAHDSLFQDREDPDDEAEETAQETAEETAVEQPKVVAWMTRLNEPGHCSKGYLAGWDGQFLESEQACLDACIANPECKAVSFCAPGTEECDWQGTCSRYGGDCSEEDLISEGAGAPHHVSFVKGTTKYVDYETEYIVKEETEKSIERIKKYLLEELPEGGKVALITMLGSFAPLTRGHLNAFDRSRDALLNRSFDAVVGVMSFNPEGHVKAKLKRNHQPNVPFTIRHALAECSFVDHGLPWMGTEGQQTWMYSALKKAPELKDHDLQLFFSNGADDVFMGRKYEECGKKFADNRKFIMVGRPGDTDQVQAKLKELGISGDDVDCLWVDNSNSFSSSQLRKAALGEDTEKVHVIADRCVAEFMNGPYVQHAIKFKEDEEAAQKVKEQAAAALINGMSSVR